MYSYKTTYGNTNLIPGFKYHFAIRIIKGNNFKIGVSRTRSNLDSAFSDTQDGWAYCSSGELRNGSKNEGAKYGENFQAFDIIGVFIDLENVRIFFINLLGNNFLLKE
jgi:hypothetical protein